MPSAENSVVIDKPGSEVFAFVADHENDPKWRRGVLDIQRASGEGIGAVYRQGIKGPFGRRIPADFEITAYHEGSHMAFRALSGPVRPEGSYRFEDAHGGTRVTFSLNADVRGPKGAACANGREGDAKRSRSAREPEARPRGLTL